MRKLILVAIAIVCAAPAGATPTLNNEEPAVEAASLDEISGDLTAYGQWLMRVEEIQQPVQQRLGTLAAEWQAAQGQSPAAAAVRFRATISEALASIDQAIQDLEALDEPDIDGFELSEDLRPAAIRQDTLRLNRELRSAIERFNPLLDAIARNDANAGLVALQQMMASLRMVVDSHALMIRASLATTPRDEASWEVLNSQLLLFHATGRIMSAWPHGMVGRRDSTMSEDLDRFAGELEATVAEGARKLDAEIVEYEREIADAERGGDAEYALLFRRLVAVLRIDREFFPLAAQLAVRIRAAANLFRDRPVTLEAISGALRDMQAVRLEFDAISRRESAALADVQ